MRPAALVQLGLEITTRLTPAPQQDTANLETSSRREEKNKKKENDFKIEEGKNENREKNKTNKKKMKLIYKENKRGNLLTE